MEKIKYLVNRDANGIIQKKKEFVKFFISLIADTVYEVRRLVSFVLQRIPILGFKNTGSSFNQFISYHLENDSIDANQ